MTLVSHESTVVGQLKRAVAISPAFVIPAIIAAVQMIIVIRLLPPDEFAGYAIALAATTATTGVLSDASANAIVRFRSGGDFEATRAGLRTGAGLGIAVSIAAAGLLLLTGHGDLAFPSAVVAAAQLWVRQQAALIRAAEQIAHYGRLVSALSVAQGLATILTAVLIGRAVGLLWAAALVNVGFAAGLAPLTWRENMRGGAPRAATKRFWAYAGPVALTAIGGQVLAVSDRFIVERLAGAQELASYYANYILAERPAGLVLAPMLAAMQPMIFRLNDTGDDRGSSSALGNLISLYACAAIPVAVFLSVFASDVSEILAGDKYLAGARIIPIVVSAVTIWNFAQIVHQPLEISRRTLVITVFVGVAAAINVVANLALVPRFGGLGAAYATFIAFSLYFVGVSIYVRAKFEARARVPLGMATLGLCCSFVVAAGGSWLVSGFASGVRLTVAVVLGSLVVAGLVATQHQSNVRNSRVGVRG